MLVKRVRTILHASRLLKNLWGEVISHVIWVKNQSATQVLDGKTPYEMLKQEKPNIADLPVWGSKCWVHDASGLKLGAQACEGHWLGFNPDSTSNAHCIYFANRRVVAVKQNMMFQRHDSIAIGHAGVTSEGESVKANENHQQLT